MQEELTDLVHAILHHGIQLKKRLLRGEPLVLENEQAILKRMLLSDAAAARWPDYGGDPATRFLGIRYVLVCWLDELFLIDSPWAKDLIKKGEVDTLKEAMERSSQEGAQTFDHALFNLFQEGRITSDMALANADSANNLRIKIKDFEIRRMASMEKKKTPSSQRDDGSFKLEGAGPAGGFGTRSPRS